MHGPATGVDVIYETDDFYGRSLAYSVLHDTAEDELTDSRIVEQDGDFRGVYRGQHRHDLHNNLELSLEGAYVTDPTFLEEFFNSEADEAKQYETSLYLKHQQDQSAATLLVNGHLSDFTTQLTTLQAPGYVVDRQPELGYHRIGEDFFDGRVLWFSENRVSRLQIRGGEDSPAERGFGNFAAQNLFGQPATLDFDDALAAEGFPTRWVLRADSRQEVNVPLDAGPIDITPYAIGRVTGYDDEFDDFADADEQYRLWGAVGTRFSTQVHRDYEGVNSTLLDLHRLRHVIEPSVDVFYMGSTVSQADLPVFDPDIEGIAEGAGVRFTLENTLQTQRGGPGRWRSVDWLKLRNDAVFRDESDERPDGVDNGGPTGAIPRFFDQRPEYAIGGDHLFTQLLWMVSDTLGVVGELTYGLEDDKVLQWRLGGTLQHTPRLSSFLTVTEIDPLDQSLLTYGFNYQLTTKYRVSFTQQYDLGEGKNRRYNVGLERLLPRWRFQAVASFNTITDEQTVGFVLIPQGLNPGGIPLTLFGGG